MHPLPDDDFRSKRYVLDDDDFLLVTGDPKAPVRSDVLIGEGLWQHITSLPDDVAIRTSSRYGHYIRRVHIASSRLVELTGLIQSRNSKSKMSALSYVTIDAAQEIEGVIYCCLVGYYKLAFSGLRDILENVVVGTWLALEGTSKQFDDWMKGNEITFNAACQGLYSNAWFKAIRVSTIASSADDLFRQEHLPHHVAGYVRRLYDELSNYAHGRPGYAHADLWKSNGPIFCPEVLYRWLNAFGATMAICAVLIWAALPKGLVNRMLLLRFRNTMDRMLYLVPTDYDGANLLTDLRNMIDVAISKLPRVFDQ